ncbi:MAG: hypothetical protein HN904_15740 [Victivallales bacterium]|nr:hypothetical protein [Victivallales bacterium]MBT7164233.1 hypothetical protein [Victivallales bacterium]
MTTVDRIDGDDLSEWLSRYRSGACKHHWTAVSGGSASGLGFGHWDGSSPWNRALRWIRKLDPVVGEAETRESLERYCQTLDVPDKARKRREIGRLAKELEDQIKQTFPADEEAR